MENTTVTTVPQITRMIARIEDWKEGHGKARGRAETDRVLGEAHKLFDENQQHADRDAAGVARQGKAAVIHTPESHDSTKGGGRMLNRGLRFARGCLGGQRRGRVPRHRHDA